MKNQQGFTLIELVVVIVILGILAAVAVPKFIDMREEASEAAVAGVAGAIASAMAVNYAACTVDNDKCIPISAITVCDGNAIINSMMIENLSADYLVAYVATTPDAAGSNGDAVACKLTLSDDYVANFTAIVAGQ